MGYKILDVKEAIKDNVSDWIIGEYCAEDNQQQMNQHFERIER